MGQEFRNSLAEWFWFKVSHDVEVRMPARAAVIWKLDQDSGICIQYGSLTWLLARGFSFLPCKPGLLECLWCGCPTASDPTKGSWSHSVFHELASEIAHHHFHYIILVPQDDAIQYRRGLPKESTLGSGDYWGPPWGPLPRWFIDSFDSQLLSICQESGTMLRTGDANMVGNNWVQRPILCLILYLQCLEHKVSVKAYLSKGSKMKWLGAGLMEPVCLGSNLASSSPHWWFSNKSCWFMLLTTKNANDMLISFPTNLLL